MENSNALKIDYLERWVRLYQRGDTITRLIKKRGYKSIAVYGFNQISRLLVYDMKNGDIELKCIIDKKGTAIPFNFPFIKPEKVRDLSVDAIIIAVTDSFQIKKELEKSFSKDIIDFGELIYEL